MGINRSISALQPALQAAVQAFIAECNSRGINILIIETDRSQLVQTAYYAQGRLPLDEVNSLRKLSGLYLLKERENVKCTDAKISTHTGGNAVDMCPEIPGKPGFPNWTAPQQEWEEIGALAESYWLDWCAGGYGQVWGKGWDNPHFELMKV